MNHSKDEREESANQKEDEGKLEKIARAIAPPSREVSDAELIDPGANAPVPKPETPAKRSTTKKHRP